MSEFNMCEVLSNATKLTPKPRESAFAFSRRLIKELMVEEFPADEWDTLPDEAQQWVNEQIQATNRNQQVEEVPGYEEVVAASRFTSARHVPNGEDHQEEAVAQPVHDNMPIVDPEEFEPEEIEEEPAPVKPKKLVKEKKPAQSFKNRPDGKPSGIVRIKEYLIEDDSLSPGQIEEKLESEGYTISRSTVVSCKADFKATVALLRSKGLLADAFA